MFAKKFEKDLEYLKKNGLYRNPSGIQQKIEKYVIVNNQKLINFSSNDYLGLSDSSALKESISKNFLKFGSSASSSRLVSANYDIINIAEEKYASYFGYDEAIFFSSGYLANLSIISTLFKKNDLIIFDKHIHASSIKGILLSNCTFFGYKHNNMRHLQKRLEKITQKQNLTKKSNNDKYLENEQIAVITESLFSMDGDFLKIEEFKNLKKQYNFLSLIDEAHAFGAVGYEGKGIASEVADIGIGTFSKAFGLFGSFVLLPKGFKEYLLNFASGIIYTTCLPPAHAAIAIDILEIIKKSKDRQEKLKQNSKLLKKLLLSEGYTVHGDAHIISVEIGDELKALKISNELIKKNFFVFSVRYPTVPLGKSILRLSMTALHSSDDIYQFIEQFNSIYSRLK